MVVVMIMPVIVNICPSSFQCHFVISSPSSSKLTSLSSNAGLERRLRYEKENYI